jgi:hypothetical protein
MRIGAIVSGIAGGALLSFDPSFRSFFAALLLGLVIAGIGVMFVPRKPQIGEDCA